MERFRQRGVTARGWPALCWRHTARFVVLLALAAIAAPCSARDTGETFVPDRWPASWSAQAVWQTASPAATFNSRFHVDAVAQRSRVDFLRTASGSAEVTHYYLHNAGKAYVSTDGSCSSLRWPFPFPASPVDVELAAYRGNVTAGSGRKLLHFTFPLLDGDAGSVDYFADASSGLPAGFGVVANGSASQLRFTSFSAGRPSAQLFQLPTSCVYVRRDADANADSSYSAPPVTVGRFTFSAQPASALNLLFHRRPLGWLAATTAQSARLPDGRTVFPLSHASFGVSVANTRLPLMRVDSALAVLHNDSLPATVFARSRNASLAAFFQSAAATPLDAAASAVVGQQLLSVVHSSEGATAVRISNFSAASPLRWPYSSAAWRAASVDGSSFAPLLRGQWLYLLFRGGSSSKGASVPMYAARVRASEVDRLEQLPPLQVLAASASGGLQWQAGGKPAALFHSQSSCASLAWHDRLQAFVSPIVTAGTSIGIAFAVNVSGPWTTVEGLFTLPTALDGDDAMPVCAAIHRALASNSEELVLSFSAEKSAGDGWRAQLPSAAAIRFIAVALQPAQRNIVLELFVAASAVAILASLAYLLHTEKKRRNEGIEFRSRSTEYASLGEDGEDGVGEE